MPGRSGRSISQPVREGRPRQTERGSVQRVDMFIAIVTDLSRFFSASVQTRTLCTRNGAKRPLNPVLGCQAFRSHSKL